MSEGGKELLLFQLGPVQVFIAQAATPADLWAGSYLLASLTLAGARAVPGWDDARKTNPAFIFPDFTTPDVIDAMEGGERIPTIPNRFLVWVEAGTGRKVGEAAKAAVRAKLADDAKKLPDGAQAQVEQFPQMGYAVLAADRVTGRMGDDYAAIGKLLAARRNVRDFDAWRESVQTGPKDFLSGKETALKDGLGAMNLLKRGLVADLGKKVSKIQTETDPYIAVVAMDGDRMGRNLSKFTTVAQHRAFSGALATFAKAVDGIVEKQGGVLVYAGGDDVLAVVQAKKAIACAKELREAFSTVKGADGKPLTASAGIAVGHEATPLQELIHAAHAAESRAKRDYGRNALAVGVFKRSGEIVHWGCNWDSAAFGLLEDLKTHVLPARFPYKLAELLRPYGDIPGSDMKMKEVVEFEFDHAWSRSAGNDIPQDVKAAADNYLSECFGKDRARDFLALFLCDTFVERDRSAKKNREGESHD